MRYTAASDGEWKTFLQDIALCVATYRRRGLALVWPEGAHPVVDEPAAACRAVVEADPAYAPGDPRPAAGWRPVPPGAASARMVAGLDATTGRWARLSLRALAAGRVAGDASRADCLLLPLEGTVRFRVGPRTSGIPHVELWLRPGEVLYLSRWCHCRCEAPRSARVLRVLLPPAP
ncbi:hypothetical protein [Streptomyces zagrosensis]|uniref:Uncharacterized protein n=1 Tax=Streptomyces zagrosensis TaxID=1042984 RepID=A0A7W9QEW9_9ACTN|nr:hypothetical protein [Streptomyces zagrosensis]MBB5939008.1 hypothetical protein [Streptomyces zagrosensis]